MPNLLQRIIILFAIFTSLLQVAKAQGHRVRIYVELIGCSDPTEPEFEISLDGFSTSIFSTGNGLAYDNQNYGSNPGSGTIIVLTENTYCLRSINENYDFNGTTCKRVYFGSPTGGPYISGYIEYMAPPLSLNNLNGSYCNSVSLSTQSGDFQYNWYVSENGTSNWKFFKTSNSSSISVNADDLYQSGFSSKYGSTRYIYVKPSGSCSAYRQSNITGPIIFNAPAPSQFSLSAQAPTAVCANNGSITISNIKYSLNNPYNGESILANIYGIGNFALSGDTTYTIGNLGSGNYSVILSNSDASCSSNSQNITVPNAPVFSSNSISGQDVSCNSNLSGNSTDGKITVSVSNGAPPYSYYLNNNLIATNSNNSYTFTGLSAGNYNVTVKDNCSSSVNFSPMTIDEPDGISVSATVTSDYNGANISCNGNSDAEITITASGGTGTLQYSISGGSSYQNNNVFSSLAAGNYNISVKDNNGCEQNWGTIEVTEPDPISISISDQSDFNGFSVSCFGASDGWVNLTITGGTGTKQLFLNGSTTPEPSNIVTGLTAGDHTIVVKDNNGCNQSWQFTLSAPPALSASGTVTSLYNGGRQISCYGASDGQITVSGTGGIAPYQFSINGVDFVSNNIFNGLAAGIYYPTIRDANGCQSSGSSVQITEPNQITATASFSDFNGFNISCANASDGSISLTVNGGTQPYSYSWSSGQTSNNISNLTAGTYTVTITDNNSCSETYSYQITEPQPLSVTIVKSNFNGTEISCNGYNDGSIDLTLNGGTLPYTYNWSTGSTTEDISNLPAGNYSVTILDGNNCSLSVNNITLSEPDALILSVDSHTNVLCNGDSSAQVTLLASGGGTTITYSLNGNNYQADNVFYNLKAGTYIFYAKDVNNCSDQVTVEISEPPALVGSITSIQNTTCNELNGSASTDIQGGTGNYTYSWTDNQNNLVGTSSSLENVGAGIYNLSVTDENGCTLNLTAGITSTDGPQVTVSDIQPTSCSNSSDGSATLSIVGSSPFSVVWPNGETGLSANMLQPGNNSVVITDANNCIAVEEINIPAPPPIEISSIELIQPSCYGAKDGSIIVSATGGSGTLTFSWDNDATGNILSNISAGEYILTIVDANNCQLQQTIMLQEVEPIEINLVEQTTPVCEGDSSGSLVVAATGGNGDFEYIWNTGQSDSTLNNVSAGSYTVTVIDAKGCQNSRQFELPDAQPFEIDPFLDIIEICNGSVFEAEFTLPGATYLWTSNTGFASTDSYVTLSTPGHYILTVTNAQGCQARDEFELFVSDDLLNADFLMVSEAYVKDTVYIIDISWPVPDSLIWILPDSITVLESGPDYSLVVFEKAGSYLIEANVWLGNCFDIYTQAISIIERNEEGMINGKQNTKSLISRFDIYPNPSPGDFVVEVDAHQEEDITVYIVDLQRNLLVLDKTFVDQKNYYIAVSGNSLAPGMYIVMIKVQNETRTKRIILK